MDRWAPQEKKDETCSEVKVVSDLLAYIHGCLYLFLYCEKKCFIFLIQISNTILKSLSFSGLLISLSLSYFLSPLSSLLSPEGQKTLKELFTNANWMDEGGLNMRNWTYYDQHYNKPGNLNLHLFPSMDNRRIPIPRPFLGRENSVMMNHNGAFHPLVSESSMHMEPVRESWVNSRERFVQQMISGNSGFGGFHEHPAAHSMQILQQQQPPESSRDAQVDVDVDVEDRVVKKEVGGSMKKRPSVATPKPPKAKKPKKGPSVPKENGNSSSHRAKPAKKNMDVIINGMDMDISSIPIPVCSCTGTHQQCYRWGCGGWQSACCTTTISMYPLPMSTKRRGARIAGRKMSQGAFKKVLEKLASENYNFGNAIDLRSHWAKHGTNKFVTIR